MGDLTKVDPQDVLDAIGGDAPADEPIDLAALGDNVLRELARRTQDPTLAANLPGTFLIRLSTYFIEKQEREARESANRTEERLLSAVEIIDHPGLSVDRKQELIREQLQRIDAESELLKLKLKELE